jgi:hypothetical protein
LGIHLIVGFGKGEEVVADCRMAAPRSCRFVAHRRGIMDLRLRRRLFLNEWEWEYDSDSGSNSDSDYDNLYIDHYGNGYGCAKPELTGYSEPSVLRYKNSCGNIRAPSRGSERMRLVLSPQSEPGKPAGHCGPS